MPEDKPRTGAGAPTTSLLGAAGEHYVMAELLRRGFIASLAPQGAPNVDVVVADVSGSQLCAVQVKARIGLGGDRGWYMRPKHEHVKGTRLFYCFVDFGVPRDVAPPIYIMPAAKVAEVLSTVHPLWLGAPGAKGQKRQDSSIRRLIPDYGRVLKGSAKPDLYPLGWMDEYLGAWHLLRGRDPLRSHATGEYSLTLNAAQR